MAYEETFSVFEDACEKAKEVALAHGCTVSVERKPHGWIVVAESLVDEDVNPDDYEVDVDEEGDQEHRIIEQEIDGYAEDLARGHGEGWFYDD